MQKPPLPYDFDRKDDQGFWEQNNAPDSNTPLHILFNDPDAITEIVARMTIQDWQAIPANAWRAKNKKGETPLMTPYLIPIWKKLPPKFRQSLPQAIWRDHDNSGGGILYHARNHMLYSAFPNDLWLHIPADAWLHRSQTFRKPYIPVLALFREGMIHKLPLEARMQIPASIFDFETINQLSEYRQIFYRLCRRKNLHKIPLDIWNKIDPNVWHDGYPTNSPLQYLRHKDKEIIAKLLHVDYWKNHATKTSPDKALQIFFESLPDRVKTNDFIQQRYQESLAFLKAPKTNKPPLSQTLPDDPFEAGLKGQDKINPNAPALTTEEFWLSPLKDGRYPFILFAQNGQLKDIPDNVWDIIPEQALRQTNKQGKNALHYIVSKRVKVKSIPANFFKKVQPEMWLVKDDKQQTPLHYALFGDTFDLLVEMGVAIPDNAWDIACDGQSSIVLAAQRGFLDIIPKKQRDTLQIRDFLTPTDNPINARNLEPIIQDKMFKYFAPEAFDDLPDNFFDLSVSGSANLLCRIFNNNSWEGLPAQLIEKIAPELWCKTDNLLGTPLHLQPKNMLELPENVWMTIPDEVWSIKDRRGNNVMTQYDLLVRERITGFYHESDYYNSIVQLIQRPHWLKKPLQSFYAFYNSMPQNIREHKDVHNAVTLFLLQKTKARKKRMPQNKPS